MTDAPIRMILLGFEHYQDLIHNAKTYQDYVRGVPVTSLTDEIKRQYSNALRVSWTAVPTSKTEYSTLKTRWDRSQRVWLQSPGCRELIAILERSSLPKINNIVCFGLGNIDRAGDDWFKLRATTQHAAALTMARVLGKRYGKDTLPVLLQDPYYNPIEKTLLTNLGFEIVGGHGALGFTLVDDASLVFTVAPDVPVRQIIADIATPAVMIWNTVKPAETALKEGELVEKGIEDENKWISPWFTDHDSPRTRKLVEGYKELEFPGDDEYLSDLKIYIRRDKKLGKSSVSL